MRREHQSDERLVRDVVKDGDEEAFRTLYRRHTPALHHLALRLVAGHAADAEDVVQEAWIRAVSRFASFRWDSALRTWLCGIVVHRSRELRRAPAARETPLEAEERGGAEREDRLDLWRAVAALAPGYREVLVLHDLEGYTHEEIGRLLEVDAGTSKSQLSRARRAVRRRLVGTGDAARSREENVS